MKKILFILTIFCLQHIDIFAQADISNDKYFRLIDLRKTLRLSDEQFKSVDEIIILNQNKIDSISKKRFQESREIKKVIHEINNESALKIEKILNREQLFQLKELTPKKDTEIEYDPLFEFVLLDEFDPVIDNSFLNYEVFDD